LVIQLIKDIGLKSFTIEGESTFGTNVIKDLLIAYKSISSLKKSKQSW
jgi:hypothetical protein